MTSEGKIRDEKLQYVINREAVSTLELLLSAIDKYEYLPDEEMLPSDESRIYNTLSLLILC